MQARFPVSGRIQTFGYRGATYVRIVPGLSCSCRRILRQYITTLHSDLSCTFLTCLFITTTTKSHRLFACLYKVCQTATLPLSS